MIGETIDSLPLWGVLLLTLAVVLLAIETGYRIGHWRSRRSEFDSEALLSAMTGANLALLAFILAFSFSLAAGHHARRMHLVLDEALAIGTTHLRAGLVDPGRGDRIRALLEDYLDIRVNLATEEQLDPEVVIAHSLDLQAAIWEQVELLAAAGTGQEMEALLVEAINSLFDIHERRVAAGLRNRIPRSLWTVLIALLALSMLGIGHFSGMKGRRNPVASTALALSFSMVVYLIADLDRPTGGMVRPDQSAILELRKRL